MDISTKILWTDRDYSNIIDFNSWTKKNQLKEQLISNYNQLFLRIIIKKKHSRNNQAHVVSNNDIYEGISKLFQKKNHSRFSTDNKFLIIKHYEETNKNIVIISSKFFLLYSSANKIIKEYKSSRIHPTRNPNEEVKLIEPTGVIADVIKDYWATSDTWFSSCDIITEIKK